MINSDGSGLRRLTENEGNNAYAEFSPDGRKIVFNSDRAGTWQVWVMNANGNHQTQLTFDAAAPRFQATQDRYRSTPSPGRKGEVMSRIAWITTAAVAIGLIVAGVSIAAQGPANEAHPLVLHLISRATAITDFVDTGPVGPSAGDMYVLFRPSVPRERPDVQIGTSAGRCVVIDPATVRSDCSFSNVLTGAGGIAAGDVIAAGSLSLVPGSTSTVAVVGGTGPYRTARGDAKVDLGPPEGPHEITVSLVLNP